MYYCTMKISDILGPVIMSMLFITDWAYRRAQTIIPRNKGTALPNRDSGVSTGSNFGSVSINH